MSTKKWKKIVVNQGTYNFFEKFYNFFGVFRSLVGHFDHTSLAPTPNRV
jgi:hypothetical protein